MPALHRVLTEPTLRELMQAGAVHHVEVEGLEGGGFGVKIWAGRPDPAACHPLITSRGDRRRFALLDTAASFLRGLGIERFGVSVERHEPGRVRAARPDRSEALRRTRTTPSRETNLLP